MHSRWIFAVILGTFPAAAASAQQSHLDIRRQIEQLEQIPVDFTHSLHA